MWDLSAPPAVAGGSRRLQIHRLPVTHPLSQVVLTWLRLRLALVISQTEEGFLESLLGRAELVDFDSVRDEQGV